MNQKNERLQRNDIGRWVVEHYELTSGDSVELLIEGHWIKGQIEFWNDDYHWFSQKDGVPVILNSCIEARRPLGRYQGR